MPLPVCELAVIAAHRRMVVEEPDLAFHDNQGAESGQQARVLVQKLHFLPPKISTTRARKLLTSFEAWLTNNPATHCARRPRRLTVRFAFRSSRLPDARPPRTAAA